MTGSTSEQGLLGPLERRRHSRSYVAGVALVSQPGHRESGACFVRNLSTGGALLLSTPPLATGATYRIALTAPHLMGEEIEGRVQRAGTTSSGAAWAAVEFLNVPEETARRLEHAVHLELLLEAAPAVLIVDGSTSRLQTLAARLAEQSRRAHLANTSLIAVDWLNGRSRDIAVAMVGDNIAGTTQASLLSFLGDEFPDIHRVLLDCEPTAEALRRMLDRVESEVTKHAPWRLDEI